MSLITLLIILLVIAAAGGLVGHSRGLGVYGWSPLGIVLVILLFLLLTGNGNHSFRLR